MGIDTLTSFPSVFPITSGQGNKFSEGNNVKNDNHNNNNSCNNEHNNNDMQLLSDYVVNAGKIFGWIGFLVFNGFKLTWQSHS